MIRSRSGGLVAALSLSTLATGVMQITVPLRLKHLQAAPAEIGVALAMFGLGLFATEWLWGIVADRYGYRKPLVISQVLYAVCLTFLARAETVPLIAAGYFFAAASMVAVGPISRSHLGTALHPHLRATGQAMLGAQWILASALGAGIGGALLDRFGGENLLQAAAILPLGTALLAGLLFRGHARHNAAAGATDSTGSELQGRGLIRLLLITSAVVLLFEIGASGEIALLPLLVTGRLHQTAAAAGTVMLAAGIVGATLLIPGGRISDRIGRRSSMVAGGLVSAAGFAVYASAGGVGAVIGGAVLRSAGQSLIWPAALAWIAESVPRRRHALMMGLFGEFENFGLATGPIVGGLLWSAAGMPAAFVGYAAASIFAAGLAATLVVRRARAESGQQVTREAGQ